MRYGENPHQHAAFYRERDVGAGLLAGYSQLQGKELSYNNIADADAAWECVRSFSECGLRDRQACQSLRRCRRRRATEAYGKAFRTDPTSAFGGIIAFNRTVDDQPRRRSRKQFVEVVIAPDFDAARARPFAAKQNVRLLTAAPGDAQND